MESLYIQPTNNTPEIKGNLERNEISFKGGCHPENVIAYFEPVFRWVDDYFTHYVQTHRACEVTLAFYFDYLNTASMKYVVEFLFKMKRVREHGAKLIVNWYYLPNDSQIEEDGHDISYAVDIPFNIQQLKEADDTGRNLSK
ncbi:MAG: DUF1987 domain-containing protein [Bacteroidales bacterium]|nr:DUF1987 domain-containing protein [Bacteroidales bacterium]